jgi:aminoglycoside/choline kinase family phosphotransferase
MDAPPEHERCDHFIDIARRLHDAGVNVPEILASDRDLGFVLLTDLGDTLYLQALTEETADKLYTDAMTALLAIQQHADDKGLPAFNAHRLLEEMHLFSDWLLGKHLDICLSANEQKALDETFQFLIDNALEQPQVFVHRDYHSRNLMVTGSNNPGIIDFQDAVTGPLTYDLVSLLKDCYIKWPRERINRWAAAFYRQLPGCRLDNTQFFLAFDLMGVQRHLKASGIFARLYHRDGKAGFLRDIPRTLSYIVDLVPEYPEVQFLGSLIHSRVLPLLQEQTETEG